MAHSLELLRDIRLDAAGGTYRLRMWATDLPDSRQNGRTRIAYAFERYEFGVDGIAHVIFSGNDFCGSPMHAEDSDDTVCTLLGFITLRRGDTDSDYFANYTPEQFAFADGDAEELSLYACEPESGEKPLPFEDWPSAEGSN